MTRAQKIKASIVVTGVVGVVLGATACVLLMMTRQSQVRSLSLFFEEYGTVADPGFNTQDVAFLRFTNSSSKSYVLPMVGSTNTFQRDTPVGVYKGSYLIIWEYDDQVRPLPQFFSTNFGRCVVVPPHSEVRLRVPLPPQGQKRRVSVLCAEQPAFRPFWTSSVGLSILRVLPRSIGRRLFSSQPAVLRVWCNHELSRPDERLAN